MEMALASFEEKPDAPEYFWSSLWSNVSADRAQVTDALHCAGMISVLLDKALNNPISAGRPPTPAEIAEPIWRPVRG